MSHAVVAVTISYNGRVLFDFVSADKPKEQIDRELDSWFDKLPLSTKGGVDVFVRKRLA